MSNQKTYVVIIDVNSLYPNIIVSHNISNETLYGVITNVNIANQKEYLYKLFDIKDELDQQFFKNFAKGRFAGRIFAFLLYANMYDELSKLEFVVTTPDKQTTYKGSELLEFLDKKELIVTGNGALFRSDMIGILAKIERDLLLSRDKYKKMLKENPDNIEANIKQQAVKILANSIYGILGTSKYLYYDVNLAEAITISGQYISFYLTAYFNNLLDGKNELKFDINAIRLGKSYYNDEQKYVLYRDTDSLFLKVKENYLNIDFEAKVKEIGIEILKNTSLRFVKNKNLDLFLQHSPKVKLEFVGDCALFTGSKKRYFIYDSKNDKYKLAGFESSSNSKIQNQILIDTLKDIVLGNITKENKDIYLAKLKQTIVNKFMELKQEVINSETVDDLEITSKVKLNADFPAYTIQEFFAKYDNVKALEKAIKETNTNIRSAIIYNTLMKQTRFTKGTKAFVIKGNYNMKAINELTKLVSPIYKPLVAKFASINNIVFDDIKFVHNYVNLDTTLKQLADKTYKSIVNQLFDSLPI